MIRAAVLVPAPEFPEAWGWAYEVEAEVLRRGGFCVEPRPWNDPGELDGFDIILPLVAWGYQFDPDRWYGLLDRFDSEGRHVLNPTPVLRWNTDKAYLVELSERGIPTIPTQRYAVFDEAALHSARSAFGDDLVIKPPISGGAFGTHRLGPADGVPPDAMGRPMMVQPLQRSVMTEGEYSLILFDGMFSHAIVKRTKAGEYRVQPHLGGAEEPCGLPAGALEVAKAALAAAPGETAYARVDLIRLDDGRLAVIELELIEPALWLQHAPDKGASFPIAIGKRAKE